MMLQFKTFDAEVDVEATRAFYKNRNIGKEAYKRNHEMFMLQKFPHGELGKLGITCFAPIWKVKPKYHEYCNGLSTFGNGPYYPVICKDLRLTDRCSNIIFADICKFADATAYYRSMLWLYGTQEFYALLPFQSNSILLTFSLTDDWVLDEAMPESLCLSEEESSDSAARENADRLMCRRIEMMLHIIGAEYTPESPEHWHMLMLRAAEKLIKPRLHQRVFEDWSEAGCHGLWGYLMNGGANNYLSAEAAEAAYDRCHASAYTLYGEHFATGGFHVTNGRLPTARQLRRFDDDFYVVPDDMSWMFARDHENYGPHFVY